MPVQPYTKSKIPSNNTRHSQGQNKASKNDKPSTQYQLDNVSITRTKLDPAMLTMLETLNADHQAYLNSYLQSLTIPQMHSDTTHACFLSSAVTLYIKYKSEVESLKAFSNVFIQRYYTLGRHHPLYLSRLHLLLNIESFLLKKYITNPSLLPSQLLPYVTTGFSNMIPKENEQHIISFLTNENKILDLYLNYYETNQDTLTGPLAPEFVPLQNVFNQINIYFQNLDSLYRKSYASYRKILAFLTSALNIQHPGPQNSQNPIVIRHYLFLIQECQVC